MIVNKTVLNKKTFSAQAHILHFNLRFQHSVPAVLYDRPTFHTAPSECGQAPPPSPVAAPEPKFWKMFQQTGRDHGSLGQRVCHTRGGVLGAWSPCHRNTINSMVSGDTPTVNCGWSNDWHFIICFSLCTARRVLFPVTLLCQSWRMPFIFYTSSVRLTQFLPKMNEVVDILSQQQHIMFTSKFNQPVTTTCT